MTAVTRILVVGTIVTGGCVEPEHVPPVLVDARFAPANGNERPSEVILSFSEPLGPVGDVDPQHFRLSTTLVIDDRGADLTVYYDLGKHFESGLPGQSGDTNFSELQPRHSLTIVAGLRPGDESNQLVLELSYPIEVAVCDALALASELGLPNGIFVHYSEGSFPRITDEARNALAAIAPDWAENPTGLLTTPGSMPMLDPTLAIPCP